MGWIKEQEFDHSSNPMGKEVFTFITTDPFTISFRLWQGNIPLPPQMGKMGKFIMFLILLINISQHPLLLLMPVSSAGFLAKLDDAWLQMLTLKL